MCISSDLQSLILGIDPKDMYKCTMILISGFCIICEKSD